jgi:hypothetical protein
MCPQQSELDVAFLATDYLLARSFAGEATPTGELRAHDTSSVPSPAEIMQRDILPEQQMPKKAAGCTMQIPRGYCSLHQINRGSARLAAIRKADE